VTFLPEPPKSPFSLRLTIQVLLFLGAAQLGCEYLHAPIYAMNDNSRRHGVPHAAAEHFFGLSRGCASARRVKERERSGGLVSRLAVRPATATAPSSSSSSSSTPSAALGRSPPPPPPPLPASVPVAGCATPYATSNLLAAAEACTNGSSQLLRAWRAGVRGRAAVCPQPMMPLPGLSPCRWRRAVAFLRAQYFGVHGDKPRLPWFRSGYDWRATARWGGGGAPQGEPPQPQLQPRGGARVNRLVEMTAGKLKAAPPKKPAAVVQRQRAKAANEAGKAAGGGGGGGDGASGGSSGGGSTPFGALLRWLFPSQSKRERHAGKGRRLPVPTIQHRRRLQDGSTARLPPPPPPPPPPPREPPPPPGHTLHIAAHVRRGDLHRLDPRRLVPNDKLGVVFGEVAEVVAELRRETEEGEAGGGYPRLAATLHVMSEGWLGGFPLRQWEASLNASNVSLAFHLSADPFETMHHLIHADVLIKTISGFSDVASTYSAGVKLYFCCAPELLEAEPPGIVVEPPGLQDPATREEFLCQLRAHLRWKTAKAEASTVHRDLR